VLVEEACAEELTNIVVSVSARHLEKRRPEVFGRGMALLWLLSKEKSVQSVRKENNVYSSYHYSFLYVCCLLKRFFLLHY